MNATALFVALLVIISAVGLVVWAWFAMALFEEQMSSLSGFEGMHFEIGPLARHGAEGTI